MKRCSATVSKSWLEAVAERAKSALSKPAPYGVDLDIEPYLKAPLAGKPVGEEAVAEAEEAAREAVGFEPSARAKYVQLDQAYFKYMSRLPGVEVKRLEDFVDENPDEAREYVWRLVDPASDKYTALAALKGAGGYFIRVKENSRVEDPVMACLFLTGGLQAPHNIVILEKNAQATVYTGCTLAPEAAGLHVGISEFYVGENAELRFVMVHAWNAVTHVRPRTGVYVADGGKYVSYYVNMSAVKTLQTYPMVTLKSGAYALLASVLLGRGDSVQDVGGEVVIEGSESSAEIVSRVVARDSSKVVTRARISANSGVSAKGHIECRGLLLSDSAVIEAVPELESSSTNAVLTHEASIGKLAEEEIYYLVSRGFTRDEAIGILVRGFVSIDIKGLPPKVKSYIETLEKMVADKAL